MKMDTHVYRLCGRWDCTHYTAHLGFEDYKKIFSYLRWRVPISFDSDFDSFGGPEEIVVRYSDCTSDKMSLVEIRNVIEKYWYHLKDILSEDGESLDKYTDEKRIYECLNKETLTLSCGVIEFDLGRGKSCKFDRIMGHVMSVKEEKCQEV